MQSHILQHLHAISNDHDVHILYTCESGSQTCGFTFRASEYDLRFLYLRQPEH